MKFDYLDNQIEMISTKNICSACFNLQFEEITCAICFEPLEHSNRANLNCSHFFHTTCIISWVKSKNDKFDCPLCRKVMIEKLDKTIEEKFAKIVEEAKFSMNISKLGITKTFLDQFKQFPFCCKLEDIRFFSKGLGISIEKKTNFDRVVMIEKKELIEKIQSSKKYIELVKGGE